MANPNETGGTEVAAWSDDEAILPGPDDFGVTLAERDQESALIRAAAVQIEQAMEDALRAELPIVRATHRLLIKQGARPPHTEGTMAKARAEVIKTHPRWWQRYVRAQARLGATQVLEGVAGHWTDFVVAALFRIHAKTADERALLKQRIEWYGVRRSVLDRDLGLVDAVAQRHVQRGRRRGGHVAATSKPTKTQVRNERMKTDFIVAVTHDNMDRADAVNLIATQENLSAEQTRRILKPLALMKTIMGSHDHVTKPAR